MQNSGKHQPPKIEKPKSGLLETFRAGVTSFWSPVDVTSTRIAADKAISESRRLCERDKELAAASRKVLLNSP